MKRAAVQGIQSFIFQTNALKEIAGASELVEQICTVQFSNAAQIEDLINDKNAIVTAAGNIKYVFDSEDQCRKVVLSFPKQIMEFAPGITISQAVVRIADGEISKNHIDELERKLRTQRNKQFRPFDVGLMAVNRSRKTGLPAVEERAIKEKLTVIDKGTSCKLEVKTKRVLKSFFIDLNKDRIPREMEDMTQSKSESYSWLAVIHADGNNMGLKMQEMANEIELSNIGLYAEKFRAFSNALDQATKVAAQNAYSSLFFDKSNYEPCRPIVIGGDDLTLIIRADLALEFTRSFLEKFEVETKNRFKELNIKALQHGLTACAGIAFIKENYPFHYGYHMAEKLCGEAKKAAKFGLKNDDLTPSCLMFHKVQASFVEEYTEIREKELTAGTNGTVIHFDFGPYYLDKPEKQSIKHLKDCVVQFHDKEGKDGNAIKSHLRQWLTDLHTNPQLAEQKKLRIISLGNQKILGKLDLMKKENSGWIIEREIIENGEKKKMKFSPIYDWLTINSINQGGK